ncbi:MAG: hypothetical protein OYL41_04740 [Acidobacteriota bacterium]|nr:hypothetical protein [Acidobacteriota bacterium]
MTRAFLAGLVFGLVAVPALAEPPPEPDEKRTVAVNATQDDADDDAPAVDYTFRLRGRFIDNLSDLGDVTVQRLSVWSDFRIGDRIQARASYDVGATRIHDLYVQYDLGGGVRLRAGRSAPLWMAEYTDAPFAFQMIGVAPGAALTQIRENGVFLFVDRGGYSGRLHVVRGSGWAEDPNGFKDVIAGVGRSFEALGGSWKVDVGHYEGRDGTGDDLIPRRQTAAHLDGTIGPNRTFRSAVYQRDQNERKHVGGFARFRQRFAPRVWTGIELGGESNNGSLENPGHLSYVRMGVRYELPWTLTHIEADYRRRFGTISDNEVFVNLQWILDFQNPRRN